MTVQNSIELHDISHKSLIADEIWGPCSNSNENEARVDILTSFFTHLQEEQAFEQITDTDIIAGIRTLKRAPDRRKSELYVQHESDSTIDIDGTSESPALDLVVRCMFLTACSPAGAMRVGGGSIFRPRWKESETLEAYFNRVFPMLRAPQQDLAAFRLGKLCASYLCSYARLQIRWTNHLSDHLILLRGERWKRLYIFRHPGFLKVSLDTLAAADADMRHTALGALRW